MSRSSVKGKNFIGFEEDVLMREFQRAFKELDALANSVQTKDIRKVQRASLKPMVARFKANITDESSFKVYRYGGVYAEIPKGTLKKSIGIINTRVRKHQTFSSLSVGPRVKRSFSDPEKGGWFAHFLEYGYLRDGQYNGPNKGFAKRARTRNSGGVGNEFKRLMRGFLNKQVKSARI